MKTEYDKHKNQANIRKHKISIPELATIFDNRLCPPLMDIPDIVHSTESEPRYYAYRFTATGWNVKVWYTYRDDVIRIIGGRKIRK